MAHHNSPKKRYYSSPNYDNMKWKDMTTTQKVMRALLYVTVGAFFIMLLTGCRTTKSHTDKVIYKHDTTTVTIRKVDTLITKEPDTASIRLLAECDENGRALLSIIDNMKGERVAIQSTTQYVTVRDTSGMVRLRTYANLQAIADGFAEKITMLEAQVQKGSTENQQLKEDLSKTSSAWLVWIIVGFVIGVVAVCLIRLSLK